jgi:glycosyltransferase involved in cell wall biosynthesis
LTGHINKKELPYVSIVVIGMNEGENLRNTFSSIRNINYQADKLELIYIDTGSVDNSVEIAGEFTDKIFIERSFWPTPGLARNRGLREAKYDIVHFVDGDMEIARDYLTHAVEKILEPGIDAVYGSLEEMSKNRINKIFLYHWNERKEGYHDATGGGGTYWKKALKEINGSDERIRKGEETEMGERFTKAGHKIWFIEEKMGLHDYGINKFRDLLKIFFLDGKNVSHLMLVNGTTDFYKRSKRKAINNFIFVILSIGLLIGLFSKFGLLAILIWVVLLYSYLLLKFFVIRKETGVHKLMYRLLAFTFRPIVLAGQLFFFTKCFIQPSFRKRVVRPRMVINSQ